MQIQQIPYSHDNLGYLVWAGDQGVAIDAGGVDDTLSFAEKNHIRITCVTNTHTHPDHTSGNKALLRKTGAAFLDCRQIKSDQTLSVGNETLTVFPTPGHSDTDVTFASDDFLVTGDTLFNGTVGNCFSGDLNAFFTSLKRLMEFPENIKIYAGHDYVAESIAMARSIEKDNPHIEEYLKKYDPKLVVSTLKDELAVNPFIRFNAQSIIQDLKTKKMPVDTEFERFNAIMEIY